MMSLVRVQPDYTIPSNNRELRLVFVYSFVFTYYTIPSNNRELRRNYKLGNVRYYYTIPSNNRELRHYGNVEAQRNIIPYRVITGNYDCFRQTVLLPLIIPYQVITGNYDMSNGINPHEPIIPYQVITGNYDGISNNNMMIILYHTK